MLLHHYSIVKDNFILRENNMVTTLICYDKHMEKKKSKDEVLREPTFQEYFAFLIQRMTISKTELAQKVGVTLGYIYNLQTGRSAPPTFEKCEQIADAMGLTRNQRFTLYCAALQERIKNTPEADYIKMIDQMKENNHTL